MEIVTTIAPVCLAVIMFGLGLGLTIGDFTRVLKNPRDFLVGFLCQVILLPIIAFILINTIPLPPEIALGVMVIAAAPGGVTSNILTKFADGDVALSVSLTAIVSLLSIFIVPLIVFNSAAFLGIETAKNISMLNIALKMFFVVTVPVIFGMIVRSLMTNFIISKTLIIQRLSVILLFKKGELALNDRYKAASDLISLIAAKSLSKSSIPIFICTLEVAIEVP